MITVFAAVICGVTFSFSAASRNGDGHGVVGDRLNRYLHALRDFRRHVVLRRHARRRQDAAAPRFLERASAPGRG